MTHSLPRNFKEKRCRLCDSTQSLLCSFSLSSLPRSPLLFFIGNGKAPQPTLSRPHQAVVPRNKCPACLWVGSPLWQPLCGRRHGSPLRVARAPLAPRGTAEVSEMEDGGLLSSVKGEVQAISCLSPRVRMAADGGGLSQNCNPANSTCVPRPACSQKESKSGSLQQPVQINRDNSWVGPFPTNQYMKGNICLGLIAVLLVMLFLPSPSHLLWRARLFKSWVGSRVEEWEPSSGTSAIETPGGVAEAGRRAAGVSLEARGQGLWKWYSWSLPGLVADSGTGGWVISPHFTSLDPCYFHGAQLCLRWESKWKAFPLVASSSGWGHWARVIWG